ALEGEAQRRRMRPRLGDPRLGRACARSPDTETQLEDRRERDLTALVRELGAGLEVQPLERSCDLARGTLLTADPRAGSAPGTVPPRARGDLEQRRPGQGRR